MNAIVPTPNKRERRRLRRRAKQQVAAAVAADIWEDRDGKARPTPERKAKGAFVLHETEDAGVTRAVDTAVTMLDQLAVQGRITAEQAHGGHDFAALMERTRLVSAGRSCLDFTPVGHDGDADPTHGELRDIQERDELYLACGVAVWSEMRWVCCDHQAPRRLDRLIVGLDLCVRFWR